MRVESVLKITNAPVEGWTVRPALATMKKLYAGRSWAAADWRQEARRMEKQAEDTENQLAGTKRELAGMKKRVDMTTED